MGPVVRIYSDHGADLRVFPICAPGPPRNLRRPVGLRDGVRSLPERLHRCLEQSTET
jgi:hypothetical protein